MILTSFNSGTAEEKEEEESQSNFAHENFEILKRTDLLPASPTAAVHCLQANYNGRKAHRAIYDRMKSE